MNITREQEMLLAQYGIALHDEINDLLMEIDDKITDIGFEDDYEYLNKDGLKLQRLYDELYDQN